MEDTPAIAKRHSPNGRDFFDQIYRNDLQLEAEWLRLTAIPKVRSITTLLRGVRFSPRSLVEVGCGTGAIIMECKRNGLAENFVAIDFSATALGYLSNSDPTITTRQADITANDFRLDVPADIVICSHVIEHLEEPDAFLKALHDRIDFKYAVIEVPLEDLIGHKWKLRGKERLDNSAGHVQFFTARSCSKKRRVHLTPHFKEVHVWP
jgi:2-polyprenyl-3-methyl-5-hydroxy-6-metoxy-1,4-benzoquinol methylase